MGPSALLIPGQKVLFETDPSMARNLARNSMAVYLELPHYLYNLRELGFNNDDFADGGSNRLLDTMVAWGSAGTVASRVRDHLNAGANQVAVQVLNRRPTEV